MNYNELLSNWYKEFPRQILIYRQWVESFDKFIEIIKETNGKDDVYASVFFYPDKNLDRPVIDKVVFDFDYGSKEELKNASEDKIKEILQKVLDEVKRFYTFLKAKDLHPIVLFTGGRGFHVYLFFDRDLKVTRTDLANFVNYVKKNLNLQYLDTKVTSDFARLIRVPYTQHTYTKLYCVPISINWNIDRILEYSKNPNPIALLRVINKASNFLVELEKIRINDNKKVEIAPEVKFNGKYLSLPCINQLFSYKLPAGSRRMKASKFIAIAYYLDHGNMDGFEEIAKIFASQQDINHKLKLKEVLGWKRGIYRLENQPPTFNCAEIKKYLIQCKIPVPCQNCEYRIALTEQKKIRAKNDLYNLLKNLSKVDFLVEVKKILDRTVVGEDKLKVLLYLLLLSKQNVVLKGEFASGKNTIADSVVDLFPEESRLIISAYTQKILRWLGRDSIPILYLKELPPEILGKAGQLKDFTFDLKLAMSDKVLEIYFVDRSSDGTMFETKTRKIRVDSVLQTTPALDMPEDYKSRVWILSTDPSEEQTVNVLMRKAKSRKQLKSTETSLNIEEVRKISDFLLKLNIQTIIPYSETIAKSVKIKNTKMRREIDKMFDLISAVTKTRFPDRLWKIKDENKFILISEVEDYMFSRILFRDYMELSVMDMEKRLTIAIDTFNKLVKEYGQVTLLDFARELKITKKKAKELLDILCDRGLIEEVEDEEDTYTSSVAEVTLEIFKDVNIQDLEKEKDEWFEQNKEILEPGKVEEFIEHLNEYLQF